MNSPYLNLVQLCLPGRERNPYTQRCVKKCPSTHERHKNSTLKRYSCLKKCKPNEERNPHTLKCRRNRITKKSFPTESVSTSASPVSIEKFYKPNLRSKDSLSVSQRSLTTSNNQKSRKSKSNTPSIKSLNSYK